MRCAMCNVQCAMTTTTTTHAGARQVGLGLLDVTKPPFGADNTGTADATEAIQAAVDAGRKARAKTPLSNRCLSNRCLSNQ